MFRVFLSSSRAAQRRSHTVLRCTRSFSHLARLAADGAKNVTSSNISADVPKDSAITPSAITEVGVVDLSQEGIPPVPPVPLVPLTDAINDASNNRPGTHAGAEESRAAIKKIMAEKRATALKLPMGKGLDLSEEDKSLLWYLEAQERRKRASEMFDMRGRVRPEFEHLQQFHKTFLRELLKGLSASTRHRKDVTRVEKNAEKRARALMLPLGDGLGLSDDEKLSLFYLTAKEKRERASGVFGSWGIPYPQFEYLRKIHQEQDAHKPKKSGRGKVPTRWTSDDIAVNEGQKSSLHSHRRNPRPIFPPGPEQAKSIERWEKVINYLMTGFLRGRKSRGKDIKRINIIGESLCG
jgi:hypothetical protein